MLCPGSQCRLGSSSRRRIWPCRTHVARQRSTARQTTSFADGRARHARGRRASMCGAKLSTVADESSGWASTLTAAELRLLPLLTTHLSFREIAERLFVSRNTVKTQAISVYRKLDASSRSEAIERAIELGLVDAPLAARGDRLHPLGMMLMARRGIQVGPMMGTQARGGVQAHTSQARGARRSVHQRAAQRRARECDARRNRPEVARPPEDRSPDRASMPRRPRT